jgi:hypothetical protein
MGRRLGSWRYAFAFAVGIALCVVSWTVTWALGDASRSVVVDLVAGIVGLVFAVSLLTGLNLGSPLSIKSASAEDGSPVDVRAGLCLLVFSLTMLFVGPFLSALLR